MGKFTKPPHKTKSPDDLMKLMLVNSMLTKQSKEQPNYDGQTELITLKPSQQGAGNGHLAEINSQIPIDLTKENEEEDSTFEAIPGLVRSQSHHQSSTPAAIKPAKLTAEPPNLVFQLREFRKQLESCSVQNCPEKELSEIMQVVKEMNETHSSGQQTCQALVRYAQENILALSKDLNKTISRNRYGLDHPKQDEYQKIKSFLERYQNQKDYCLNEFSEIYQTINQNMLEMEQVMYRNQFQKNNEQLRDFVRNQKTSHHRAEVNQIIRQNHRHLEQFGEKQLGGRLIQEFHVLQEKSQNKLADAFKILGGGTQTRSLIQSGGGSGMLGGFLNFFKDNTAPLMDEISINNQQAITPKVKIAQREYLRAKQELIERKQSLLKAQQEINDKKL